MKEFMKTILNAVMAWVRGEYRKATDEEILDILAQEDALIAVKDYDGAILSFDDNVIIW